MERDKFRAAAASPYALVPAGAALLALGWMPTGLAPLMPLGALLVIRGARRIESRRQIVGCALLATLAYHGLGSHFLLVLVRYSWLALAIYPMTLAYYFPFWLLLFWGGVRLERRTGLARPLLLTLLYPLLERLRTIGELSFPADLHAHAFGTNPGWLAWTPWIGPFGVSLTIWGVGAMLDRAVETRRDRGRALVAVGLALALWLAPPLSDRWLHPRQADPGPELRVSIIQPGVEVRDKLDRAAWPSLWARMERLTLSAAGGADLVIWPETARPGPLIWRDGEPLRDAEMESLSARAGVPILYGCEIARVREGRVTGIWNGAALVRPGATVDWYGKQRLLPFIEGVPLGDLLGWDPSKRQDRKGERSLLTLMGNFARGPAPTVFEVGPARIGVLICLEGQYPVLGRRLREAGANTLAVLTNDAWWGRSIFASWHARMIASQARSLGVPVVRAANSGVSSITDRFGRLQASTNLSEVTSLRASFTPSRSAPTFFAHNGDLLPFGILTFLAGAMIARIGVARPPATVDVGSPS